MSELRLDSGVPVASARAFVAERAEPCVRLDELFGRWRASRGEFPYGAQEFLAWLHRLG